jgi:type II secretory pathway pseudopilin PulG
MRYVHMNISQKHRSEVNAARSGFSLLEAIVGMAVLGITCVALYSGIASGYTTVQFARENLRAMQILVEKMEVIRLYNWDQLNEPGFIPTSFEVVYYPLASEKNGKPDAQVSQGVPYYGKITITDPPFSASYSSKLKLVTVDLTWTTGRIKRSRSLSTLVAFDGLQSYIY